MRTNMPKISDINHEWLVVDAENQVLGRLASKIAVIIRGKNKPSYAPHLDVGDNVIVVNAEKIVLTGRKAESKVYKSYSGYPSGLKERSFKEQMEKKPETIIYEAVKGMLPKNRLGRKLIKKLRVYTGPKHNQEAQKPRKIEL